MSLSNKYKKLEGREHVLTRPGMYIGSVDEDSCQTWVFKENENRVVKESVKYVAGLYKIFDEILVNAIDHAVRLKSQPDCKNLVKSIKIVIDKNTGVIEVTNDGEGIEIEKHPEHGMYIPELIFGNLLTSTNYDDNEEKCIGGQNGIGAKACNIFSKFFEIETVDSNKKKVYKQRFEDNMSKVNTPLIEKYTKKPYTTIRFMPDYAKFNMKGLTDDMYSLMLKRVYDTCAVTDNDVSVFCNGKKLEFKNFESYVNLYLGDKNSHARVYEKINERWEVVASYNDFSGFEQVSFVNGIWTLRGGKHVDYIVNQITKKLIDLISKKKKDINIKPQIVKDNLIVFVKSTVVNPSFDSQSKETLTTPASKFGSKGEVSDKFIEKLYKSGIVEKICEISQVVDNNKMKKTDGKKRTIIKGVHKLDDANWAGSGKSKDCVLILTEGDSAKSMAIAGLSEVGRDRYGVFPLRGKILNVKDVTMKKISENEEISTLKKIIGLEAGKDYKSIDDLRYGRIMIMCDQDHDGSHIKGLLFNMFHTLWPSLLIRNDFISSMLTPIIKVKKGKDIISFYSMTDYENWKHANNDGKGWDIKYYKGLGTSDNQEAKEYFRQMKMVSYKWDDSTSNNVLDLAFNKKRADDRKEWLGAYDKQTILDCAQVDVSYDEFVNKELIHFSNYDIERSIPSICDGLKISQRKILYAAFKKNLYDKEIKVAQFCGYVMEHTSYHHGDASLQAAIIGMAQDFVGSNNINLFKPNGQFGTRIQGGKDSGAPRYINTVLHEITPKIFIKQDQYILNYLNDDGFDIEPEFYMPIIPMVLVNGAIGIGTGFSTNIPCYNPRDIISVLRRLLNNDETVDSHELTPWYRGFTGSIQKCGDKSDKWISRGRVSRLSATKIEVKELPVGYWTEDFKIAMEDYYEKNADFKNYESFYDEKNVHFILTFSNSGVVDELMCIETNSFTRFENEFKLVSLKLLGTTNMYLFNNLGQIKKYNSAIHIIKEFYNVRLSYYQKRKDFMIQQLLKDNSIIENKIRFIKEVVNETIIVHKMKKIDLEVMLKDKEYMLVDDTYDYLLRIPVYNLTIDKVEDLEDEYRRKCEALEKLVATEIKDMWKEELDNLDTTLSSVMEASIDKKITKGKGGRKIKTT
uniref:DNA topoisomerase (ATP-hydrolyzing) n=1 Tax=viral metagenome TaxID=1070528 RepID=A0A6C0BF32_9ZZZZ